MLEIKFIRQNLSEVQNALSNRGESIDLETFKDFEADRRTVLSEIENLRHRRNIATEQIAELKTKGVDATEMVTEMRQVSVKIKNMDKELSEIDEKINQILLSLPNIPHPSVPIGKDSSQNPVIRQVGKIPEFNFEPKPHWTLGEDLKILDFDRASKITGARFPLYFGAGAKLERALINFMLDIHTQNHGYKEVLPPFIVNRSTMTQTGQLPKFDDRG